ncbi:MAG: ABC transporter permease [Saprospiraceae bacterium]
MNLNSIKILFRTLWSGKLYTLINIVGLAIGITAIVWAYQDYRFAMSFNNFHKDSEHIFRVITKNEGSQRYNGYCPLPLALTAKQEFSTIKQTLRIEGLYTAIKGNQEETFSSYIHFTDPAFFDFFNFPLIEGSNDLKDRSSVLLTQSEAKKFFGTTDPIGQTLLLYAGETYQQTMVVKGILKDAPVNSSIQFNILTNLENYLKGDGTPLKSDDWSWMADVLFLKLSNAQDAGRLAEDFKKYLPLQYNARKDIKIKEFVIEPLSMVATHDEDMGSDGLNSRPNASAIYGPMALAILILLSACLNFANTTVARSNRRLKEMGVRKVLGGTKSQLILQQLAECLGIVILSVLLSMLMNTWWIPKFNSMFNGIKLDAHYFQDPGLLKFILIIPVIVTILAGIYPAYYISRYNATQIFRGGIKLGGSNLFSRLLLGLQIMIAFITVTAGFAFARNSKFQRDYDFGFNQKNIIGINLSSSVYVPFRDALSQIPGIQATAGSKGHLGFSWRNLPIESEGVKKEINYFEIGEHYLDVMGMKLTQGRGFNEENESDIKKSIIVSEQLCAAYGWKPEAAIGKQMQLDTLMLTVIGVAKDIYMGGFFNRTEPPVYCQGPLAGYRTLIVKTDPTAIKSVHDQIKAKWTALYPLKPFNSFYQDMVAAEAQDVNNSIATIFLWFAIISVLFTATGMFALISLTILKKNREIAIRRVVGASMKDIVAVINNSYLLIFIISSFLGIFAGKALTKLLMDLIFKINIGVNMTTIAQSFVGICLLILLVIGIKIFQVGKMKPASVLKANQ